MTIRRFAGIASLVLVTLATGCATTSQQPGGKRAGLILPTGNPPAGSVGTAQLAPDSVTNPKFADMPTLTLKGNATGGSANPTDLTIASTWTMLGTQAATDVFTTPGANTWTKRAGVRVCFVYEIGGGGGGGSGGVATASGGGNGGSGGAWSFSMFPASVLGGTETVTVGAGGTGAPGTTTDTTAGTAGSAGGNTTFGAWLVARGGPGGNAGGTAGGGGAQLTSTGSDINGGGGGGGAAGAVGANGQITALTSGNPGSSGRSASGGGGGGGILFAGGDGGFNDRGLATSAKVTGAAVGVAGTNGLAGTVNDVSGGGGGSGSGGGGAGANSLNGGNGGLYGGGGGGSGAAAVGFDSGNGGNGANGIAIVSCF